MNKVVLMGRLTKEPDVRNTQSSTVARFTLAVDRRFKREGEATADFIGCVAFGKTADFIEKYITKGTKIALCGRIQTGSYTNREGNKVYTTDVIVEEVEFAERKRASNDQDYPDVAPEEGAPDDDFMSIPDGLDDELPFR